jgi:hypothetical protein
MDPNVGRRLLINYVAETVQAAEEKEEEEAARLLPTVPMLKRGAADDDMLPNLVGSDDESFEASQ